jgi:hypothetical protein
MSKEKPKNQFSNTESLRQDDVIPAKEQNIDNRIHKDIEQGNTEGGAAPAARDTSSRPRTQKQIAQELLGKNNLNPQYREWLENKYSSPEPSSTPENVAQESSNLEQQQSTPPVTPYISPENVQKLEKLRNSSPSDNTPDGQSEEPKHQNGGVNSNQSDTNISSDLIRQTDYPGDFTPELRQAQEAKNNLQGDYGQERSSPKQEPSTLSENLPDGQSEGEFPKPANPQSEDDTRQALTDRYGSDDFQASQSEPSDVSESDSNSSDIGSGSGGDSGSSSGDSGIA